MSSKIKTYAATEAAGKFEPFEFDPGELGNEQVEIKVDSCGVCHSDLSMLNNDWQMTEYPFVGGHEAVGEIIAVGENAKGVQVGDKVGLGWNSGSLWSLRTVHLGLPNNVPRTRANDCRPSWWFCRQSPLSLVLGDKIAGRNGYFKSRTAFLWRNYGF